MHNWRSAVVAKTGHVYAVAYIADGTCIVTLS